MIQDFAPIVALATLVLSVTNVLKYARGGDFNGVFTQAAAWVAGVASVMLAAQTDFADGISVGTISLASANAWSQLFIGLTVASVGSGLWEGIKAVDRTQTTVKPDLIPGTDTVAVPPAPPQG